MSHWAAITVLGHDRPGIVAGVTEVLYRHGCNLEDSSATRLRDSFAMILLALLPEPPRLDDLTAALQDEAEQLGIHVDVRDLGHVPAEPQTSGVGYLLVLYGADQPGIVCRVAMVLAELACNVDDVTTRIVGASDAPVCIMILELTAPPDLDQPHLDSRLAELRQELNVDISLRRLDDEPAAT